MLKSDVILVSDTSLLSKEVPSITVGLRGLAYMDVSVQTARADMHSGLFGGAVANPINTLAKMIAQLKDDDNKITIPGFYDGVKFPSDRDREMMRNAPFDEQEYMDSPGVYGLEGQSGFHTYERTGILPTLDCNGIWGGFTGEGSKTIIPAKASAKISMRLVSEQDWQHDRRPVHGVFQIPGPRLRQGHRHAPPRRQPLRHAHRHGGIPGGGQSHGGYFRRRARSDVRRRLDSHRCQI